MLNFGLLKNILDIRYLTRYINWIFFFFCGLSFHFSSRILWSSKVFNFDEICILKFFIIYLCICLYVSMSSRWSERCWLPKVVVPGSNELSVVGAGCWTQSSLRTINALSHWGISPTLKSDRFPLCCMCPSSVCSKKPPFNQMMEITP